MSDPLGGVVEVPLGATARLAAEVGTELTSVVGSAVVVTGADGDAGATAVTTVVLLGGGGSGACVWTGDSRLGAAVSVAGDVDGA